MGARVDELLEMGRRLNPGVAARTLEAEAATPDADAAGRFPDPTFTTEIRGHPRNRRHCAPESLGRVKYTLAQTIPLWGKRGLERRMAKPRRTRPRRSDASPKSNWTSGSRRVRATTMRRKRPSA